MIFTINESSLSFSLGRCFRHVLFYSSAATMSGITAVHLHDVYCLVNEKRLKFQIANQLRTFKLNRLNEFLSAYNIYPTNLDDLHSIILSHSTNVTTKLSLTSRPPLPVAARSLDIANSFLSALLLTSSEHIYSLTRLDSFQSFNLFRYNSVFSDLFQTLWLGIIPDLSSLIHPFQNFTYSSSLTSQTSIDSCLAVPLGTQSWPPYRLEFPFSLHTPFNSFSLSKRWSSTTTSHLKSPHQQLIVFRSDLETNNPASHSSCAVNLEPRQLLKTHTSSVNSSNTPNSYDFTSVYSAPHSSTPLNSPSFSENYSPLANPDLDADSSLLPSCSCNINPSSDVKHILQLRSALSSPLPSSNIKQLLANLTQEKLQTNNVWLNPCVLEFFFTYHRFIESSRISSVDKDSAHAPYVLPSRVIKLIQSSNIRETFSSFLLLFVNAQLDTQFAHHVIPKFVLVITGQNQIPWPNIYVLLKWLTSIRALSNELAISIFQNTAYYAQTFDSIINQFTCFSNLISKSANQNSEDNPFSSALRRIVAFHAIRIHQIHPLYTWLTSQFTIVQASATWTEVFGNHITQVMRAGNFVSISHLCERCYIRLFSHSSLIGARILQEIYSLTFDHFQVHKDSTLLPLLFELLDKLCRFSPRIDALQILKRYILETNLTRMALTYFASLLNEIILCNELNRLCIDLYSPSSHSLDENLSIILSLLKVSLGCSENFVALLEKLLELTHWKEDLSKAILEALAKSEYCLDVHSMFIKSSLKSTHDSGTLCEDIINFQARFLKNAWYATGSEDLVYQLYLTIQRTINADQVSPVLFTAILDVLLEAENYEMVFSLVLNRKINVGSDVLAKLLVAGARTGHWELVGKLLDEHESKDLRKILSGPSHVANGMLKEHIRDFGVIEGLVYCKSLCTRFDFKPNRQSLNVFALKLLREGKPDLIIDVLSTLPHNVTQVELQYSVIPTWINTWICKWMPDVKGVMNLMVQMKQLSPKFMTLPMIQVFKQAVQHFGNSANRLHKEMGIYVTGGIYSDVYKRVFQGLKGDEYVRNLEELKREVKLCVPWRDQAFEKMKMNNEKAKLHSCFARIDIEKAMLVEIKNNRPSVALKLFRENWMNGIYGSRTAVKRAMLACKLLGREGLEEASKLIDEMCRHGRESIREKLMVTIMEDEKAEDIVNATLSYYDTFLVGGSKLKFKYRIAASAANRLLERKHGQYAVEMLKKIHEKFGHFKRFDRVIWTVFLRAFTAIGDIRGITWVVNEAISTNVQIDEEFMWQLTRCTIQVIRLQNGTKQPDGHEMEREKVEAVTQTLIKHSLKHFNVKRKQADEIGQSLLETIRKIEKSKHQERNERG